MSNKLHTRFNHIRIYQTLLISIIIASAIILTPKTSKAQTVYLSEGFESGERPSNWTEEKTNSTPAPWRYQDGGYAISGSNYKYPAHAHTGKFNAIFQIESPETYTSKLITPALDLVHAIKPVLTFWHAQDKWGANTDQLKVYYRTSPIAGWILLEEFLFTTPNWTLRTIVLPEEARTATCQLAFEGISKWGYGACIDDIDLIEKGILPRQVQSVDFVQRQQPVATGLPNAPIGYIPIDIYGNSGDMILNKLALTYTGTAASDIAANGINLFYTRDTIFTNDKQINIAGAPISGGEVTFTGLNQLLQTGLNYIWVTASIASNAIPENIVDFKLEPNSLQVGSNSYPSITIDPIQKSTIEESLFADDFETNKNWILNGVWQEGIPTGKGIGDPTKAFAGNNILATNLSGNYPANVTTPELATIPNSLNCKYYKDLHIRFMQWLNFDYFDKISISATDDGGLNWSPIWNNVQVENDNYWKPVSHDISKQATRKDNIAIKISLDESDQQTEYGGWNIDNFAITGKYIDQDLGMLNVSQPTMHCGMGSSEPVVVTIKNFGAKQINPPYQIGYSIDNGATFTKETVNQTIPVDGTYEYTFTQKANLSSFGEKKLVFKTFLTNDDDETNDAISQNVFIFPASLPPYSNSFENNDGYWRPYGTNSCWQWGIPSKTKINGASDGTKVWVTKLKDKYNTSEQSYLESPCFDFTGLNFPVLSFKYFSDVEPDVDGFTIQYSIDGGTTWQVVDASAEYSSNWCPQATISALGTKGWSQTTSSYTPAYTALTSLAGQASVKFRIAFASNDAENLEGVAIDDIKVYELPMDAGILSIDSPTTPSCESNLASLPIKFTIKNNGIKPIKTGTTIPARVKVGNGEWKNETILVGTDLAKDATMQFTSTATFNFSNAGNYGIIAHLSAIEDINKTNDTLKTSVAPTFALRDQNNELVGATYAVNNIATANLKLKAGPEMTNYKWTKDGVTIVESNKDSILAITATGIYIATVTNSTGCTKSAQVEVKLSTRDIGITSITSPISACSHTTSEEIKFKIKNLSTTNTETATLVPVTVKLNGTTVITTNISVDLAVNEEKEFSLGANTLSLIDKGEYKIDVECNMDEDMDLSNNKKSVSVWTWATPDVSFAQAIIATINPVGIELTAQTSPNITTHVWKKGTTDVGTNSAIYKIESKESAIYTLTVTNSCGNSASASVTINAKDLGLTLSEPLADVCTNTPNAVKVVIKNNGKDTYPAGSTVKLTYTAPGKSNQEIFTFAVPLAPEETYEATFKEKVTFTGSSSLLQITSDITGDAISSNNSVERSVTVNELPSVNIEPSKLFKVFTKDESYTISPTYSPDVKTYLWQDGTTYDTYTIIDQPAYKTYVVTATNNAGCYAKDSIEIISNDLGLSAIKSPVNKCVFENNTPITITIKNAGNTTYAKDTKVTVKVSLDGTSLTAEELILPTALAPQATIDYTLTQTAQLAGKTRFSMIATIEETNESNLSNNTLNKEGVLATPPTISLGADREVHAWQEILDPGVQFKTYTWQDNITKQQTFTATQTGKYSVTVTDYNNCSASAEVNLTFFVDDIQLVSMDNPTNTNSCSLTNNEPISLTIKNTSTAALAAGKAIPVTVTFDGSTINETLALTSDLAAGATCQLTLAAKLDFTTKKTYPITVVVNMTGDMRSDNNTSVASIVAKNSAETVTLGSDIVQENPPITLDAQAHPGHTYLWNNGATSQTLVVTNSGNYTVTITNADGCSTSDAINVRFTSQTLTVTGSISPVTQCSSNVPQAVVVEVTNNGLNTLVAGTSIPMAYKLNEAATISDNWVLATDLAPGDKRNFEFTQKATISKIGQNSLYVYAFYGQKEERTSNFIFEVKTSPSFQFATKKIEVTSFPYNLVATGGNNYLWSNGTTTANNLVGTPGVYWVQVSLTNGCSVKDTIEVVNINAVGENEFITTLKYYPVPATYILNVEASFKANTELTLQIIDVTGGIKWQNSYESAGDLKEAIPLNDLKSGTYILKVTTPQGATAKAFIIND